MVMRRSSAAIVLVVLAAACGGEATGQTDGNPGDLASAPGVAPDPGVDSSACAPDCAETPEPGSTASPLPTPEASPSGRVRSFATWEFSGNDRELRITLTNSDRASCAEPSPLTECGEWTIDFTLPEDLIEPGASFEALEGFEMVSYADEGDGFCGFGGGHSEIDLTLLEAGSGTLRIRADGYWLDTDYPNPEGEFNVQLCN